MEFQETEERGKRFESWRITGRAKDRNSDCGAKSKFYLLLYTISFLFTNYEHHWVYHNDKLKTDYDIFLFSPITFIYWIQKCFTDKRSKKKGEKERKKERKRPLPRQILLVSLFSLWRDVAQDHVTRTSITVFAADCLDVLTTYISIIAGDGWRPGIEKSWVYRAARFLWRVSRRDSS